MAVSAGDTLRGRLWLFLLGILSVVDCGCFCWGYSPWWTVAVPAGDSLWWTVVVHKDSWRGRSRAGVPLVSSLAQ